MTVGRIGGRRWVCIALIAFALLICGGYEVARGQTPDTFAPLGRQTTNTLDAVPVGDQSFVEATIDNQIRAVGGTSDGTGRAMDTTLTSLAARPGQGVWVGTTRGDVYALDTQLRGAVAVHVSGRVVALVGMPDGGLAIAHGNGQYRGTFAVTRVGSNGQVQPNPADFAFVINAVAPLGNAVVVALESADIVAVDPNGAQLWAARSTQPATTLAVIPGQDKVLAGDRRGDLTLFNRQGATLGTVKVSPVAVTSITVDAQTRTIVVGDERGNLRILDYSGHVLLTKKGAGSPIVAVVSSAQGYLAIPQSGAVSRVVPSAAATGALLNKVRNWIFGLAAAAVLVAAGLIIWGSSARRHATAVFCRRVWTGRLAYLLLAPAVILVAVFSYYPAMSALYYSFTDFSLRGAASWIGLDNYVEIIAHDSYFHQGIVNMAIITAASFVKTITVPLLAAELVYWLKNRVAQYVFRTLFVLSAVVPGLVLTLLWKNVYDPYAGLINELLRWVGLDSWTRAWLGDPTTALAAIIGVGFPYITAFAFLVFLGGLLTIDHALHESVELDGAGRWGRFWHIDVPLLAPQFRLMAFFAFLSSIEGFVSIFVLTGGGPGDATYVPALEMYLRISDGSLGYASALGVILFLIMLIITVGIMRRRPVAVEGS